MPPVDVSRSTVIRLFTPADVVSGGCPSVAVARATLKAIAITLPMPSVDLRIRTSLSEAKN
jgi:hypothetical protein